MFAAANDSLPYAIVPLESNVRPRIAGLYIAIPRQEGVLLNSVQQIEKQAHVHDHFYTLAREGMPHDANPGNQI
jgi:hypothetical protein